MRNLTPLFKYRAVLAFFIFGLVVSGVTAFPLLGELRILAGAVDYLRIPSLSAWVHTVHQGLEVTYAAYPWIAYGTDWLAFGHLMIAVFFIGPWMDPASGRWTLISGVIACVLILPLAVICGSIRGIPWGWMLVDCSFGFFGIFPLLYCLKLQRDLSGNLTRQ